MKLIPGKLYRLRRFGNFFPWPQAKENHNCLNFPSACPIEKGEILMFVGEEENEAADFIPYHIFLVKDKVLRCSRHISLKPLSQHFEEIEA